MSRILVILLLGALLQSCSPKVRSNLASNPFPPLEENTEILVLKDESSIPNKSNYVGILKIGDSGPSTDCDYQTVIENAKSIARKSGANLVILTEVKEPGFGSICYRLKAELYRNVDSQRLAEWRETIELGNKSRLPEDADYAVVYFYRPANYLEATTGYKIRLDDDTVIGKVGNGEKFEYRITEFGKHVFVAKTEFKDSIELDIEKGKEYFVRCSLKSGVVMARPEMYLIENYVGIEEYEEMEQESY